MSCPYHVSKDTTTEIKYKSYFPYIHWYAAEYNIAQKKPIMFKFVKHLRYSLSKSILGRVVF